MRLTVLVLSMIVLTASTLSVRADERPIIFIPGIIGSKLVEQGDPSKVVWGSLASLRKSQTAKMNLLPASGTPVPLEPGDILRDFNLAFGAFEVGIYSHLINFLTGTRQSAKDMAFSPELTENQNFFVFAYDWRRSVFANGVRFAHFIEEKVPNGEFDIVAHSMGGLVTRAMLSSKRPGDRCVETNADYPADIGGADLTAVCTAAYFDLTADAWDTKPDVASRLHSFVEVGVPHFGSVATVSTMRDGSGSNLANRLLGGLTHLQDVSTSMVGVFELTPTYENCCWIKSTDDDSFRQLNLFRDSFIRDHWMGKIVPITTSPCGFSNCDQRAAIIEIGLANRALLDEIMADKLPDGVQSNHVLRGTKTSDTPSRYYVERPFRNAQDSIVVDGSLDGDGTVHEFSAKAPGASGQAGVNEGLVAFTKHQALFRDSATKRYLGRFVIDEVAPPPAWSSAERDDLQIAGATIDATSFEAVPSIVEPGQSLPLAFIADRVNSDGNAFDQVALEGLRYGLQYTRLDDGADQAAQDLSDTLSLAEETDLRAVFRGSPVSPEVEGIYLYEVLMDGVSLGETTVYVLSSEG